MSAYRLSSPYERQSLRRRASGLALALCVNAALLLVLWTLGELTPVARRASQALIVDMLPESHSKQSTTAHATAAARTAKAPPIVIPSKPTIAQPPRSPMIKMSPSEYAATDIGNLPKSDTGNAGDSQVVGTGPHGETLYAAEWARHPTDAELGGYLPHNAPDGFGTIACRTAPGDRVEDCIELDQGPPGSHLATAVRQAAWQFRVRPPRKNGVALVGSWVSIRIDYESYGRPGGDR